VNADEPEPALKIYVLQKANNDNNFIFNPYIQNYLTNLILFIIKNKNKNKKTEYNHSCPFSVIFFCC